LAADKGKASGNGIIIVRLPVQVSKVGFIYFYCRTDPPTSKASFYTKLFEKMVASFGLQTLGILNKQVILQARQRKTIIVQIVITCFFLIFYGWWNLQFGKIGGYIQPPIPVSASTQSCFLRLEPRV
jgi:hypothetical protein